MSPIPTPMLDKARSEELTSSEITAALRELSSLSGTRVTLECRFNDWHGYEWRVNWRSAGSMRGIWKDYIEDALVADADELLRVIAEERDRAHDAAGDPLSQGTAAEASCCHFCGRLKGARLAAMTAGA